MKKLTLTLLVILSITNTSAAVSCINDFADSYNDFNVLRASTDKSFLENNWNKIPVLKEMEKERCIDVVDMNLIKVKNKYFWMMISSDDSCDGGNTYGVIYNYSLTKVAAEVQDGDVYCK
jgi:thioredoxin-related protein